MDGACPQPRENVARNEERVIFFFLSEGKSLQRQKCLEPMKVIMKLCSECFMATHYGAIKCPRLSSLLTPGFLVSPSPACFLTPVAPPEQEPHALSIRLPSFRYCAHIYCPKSLSSYKFIEQLLCWAPYRFLNKQFPPVLWETAIY